MTKSLAFMSEGGGGKMARAKKMRRTQIAYMGFGRAVARIL